MNPLLPRVLGANPRDGHSPPRHLVLELHVPAELAHFDGHFPGLPVLPGVVQVDWAVRFARERLALAGDFLRLENLKFLALVRPGSRLQLELRLEPDGGLLAFAYASGARKCSSGRLVFARAGGAPALA